MNEYVISARKYRPKSFQKVIGQKHITNTSQNTPGAAARKRQHNIRFRSQ